MKEIKLKPCLFCNSMKRDWIRSFADDWWDIECMECGKSITSKYVPVDEEWLRIHKIESR